MEIGHKKFPVESVLLGISAKKSCYESASDVQNAKITKYSTTDRMSETEMPSASCQCAQIIGKFSQPICLPNRKPAMRKTT